ncbi:MAG TPA: fatty acid--CoA ligase family protein [Acidimicrobiia bacterium]|nr:fatty acid--CoA ligase family protein [Acidimicrobiia bacterium]
MSGRLVAVLLPRSAAAQAIDEAWDAGDAVAALDPGAPRGVIDTTLARLRPTHLVDEDGRRALRGGSPPFPPVGAVVLTSGTTGTPKAVELATSGLAAVGAGANDALQVTPTDRWLVCLPLHHVAGLAILARARAGGQHVVVHDGFDADAVSAAPRAEGATLVSVVPTTLARLLDRRAPLHEYRRIVVGGAPLPAALRERAEVAGAPVVDAYGLSETGGGVVFDGRPMAGAAVELTSDDEIVIKGPMVMRGYRDDPEATAGVLGEDGWLHTGDVGRRDGDGSIHLVDRRRDLVITGGVNVSPTAVEGVLGDHPQVADVCVAGTPDEQWGERVVAFVVPRPGEAPPSVDALRDFARARLRAAELPREVVVVEAIPRSPSGKVHRRSLPTPS